MRRQMSLDQEEMKRAVVTAEAAIEIKRAAFAAEAAKGKGDIKTKNGSMRDSPSPEQLHVTSEQLQKEIQIEKPKSELE